MGGQAAILLQPSLGQTIVGNLTGHFYVGKAARVGQGASMKMMKFCRSSSGLLIVVLVKFETSVLLIVFKIKALGKAPMIASRQLPQSAVASSGP